MAIVLKIKEAMGYGYEHAYWLNCPVRYRIFYGARNTKKSWNASIEIIDKIITSPVRNVICFRRNYVDIKDSIFGSITNKLYRTGLFIKFKIKTSPFEITYVKTGQKILFKGCDRGTSINSNEVTHGELTDFYFEEAYELEDYETFRQIDGSLRGVIVGDATGIPKQVTLLLNPWHKEGCWIYDVFVKNRLEDDNVALQILETLGKREWCDKNLIIEKGKGLYLIQTSYLINEFRDKEIYDKTAIEQKKRSLDIYLVEYMGFWGATGEVVYPEFTDKLILSRGKANSLTYKAFYLGLDTGYSNGENKPLKSGTPSAVHTAYVMTLCGITADTQMLPNNKDVEGGTIVAINEYYWANELQTEKKTQPQLFEDTINKLCEWLDLYQFNSTLLKGTIYVFVDCADAGSLTSLQEYARRRGLIYVKFMPSTKFKIHTRIMYTRLLMSWSEMLYSEACTNLIREIKQCRKGDKGEERADINDHAINSYEYATAPMYVMSKKWLNFKQK